MDIPLWLIVLLCPGLLAAPVLGVCTIRRRSLDLRWTYPALQQWALLYLHVVGFALLAGRAFLLHVGEWTRPEELLPRWRRRLAKAIAGSLWFAGMATLSWVLSDRREGQGGAMVILAAYLLAFACTVAVTMAQQIRHSWRPANGSSAALRTKGVPLLGMLAVALFVPWLGLVFLVPYVLDSLGLIDYVGYGAATCIAFPGSQEASLNLVCAVVFLLWGFQSLWHRRVCGGQQPSG